MQSHWKTKIKRPSLWLPTLTMKQLIKTSHSDLSKLQCNQIAYPSQMLAIDLVCLIPLPNGKWYILVAIDCFSRLQIFLNKEANTVAKELIKILLLTSLLVDIYTTKK